jgi:N-dimethylarginine dimethylaminohydrolase
MKTAISTERNSVIRSVTLLQEHTHLRSQEILPKSRFTKPTFLMCSPEWYDVRYAINPWMAGSLHQTTRDKAFAQWKELYVALKDVADVQLLPSKIGLPDMTFVAHGAVVNYGLAVLSNFAHAQRKPETNHLHQWLQDAGFIIWQTPHQLCFEGEGDALFAPDGTGLWAAHGIRTCRQSHRTINDAWHTKMTSLRLIDPRFYHLDTCFIFLSGGHVLYFAGAFDSPSLEKIKATYPFSKRIELSEADAVNFGCNLINIGKNVLMHAASGNLANRLLGLGYHVGEVPLSEFLKGGGAAKSLALRLSDLSVTHQAKS